MHIHKRGNTYNYRRRVPLELRGLLHIKEYRRALVPNIDSAKMIAATYDTAFNQMLLHLRLGIKDRLSEMLEILGLNQQTKLIKKVSIYKAFLKDKEDIAPTSYREYKQQLALFEVLLPSDLRTLSYPHLDHVKEILLKLPKRNIQKYRDMPLTNMIKAHTLMTDRISTKSQNEYLKTLRALIKFAVQRDYIDKELEITLFKNKTSARNQRQALNENEVKMLFTHTRLGCMAQIMYYSGMRLSEVYKCRITTVDGIKCFDLTNKSIELKTESSYRIIPIHGAIKNNIEEVLESARNIKDYNATKLASKALKTKGKTLYSLRHSFATELAAKGIEPHIISELLGHSRHGMTLNRYVKGFPTKLLSESINKLDAV